MLTVYLTAGDNGSGESYWAEREEGIEAAYAQMVGVDNVWTTSTLTVGTHNLVMET